MPSIPSKRKLDSQSTSNQAASLKRTTRPGASTTALTAAAIKLQTGVSASTNKARGGGGKGTRDVTYEDEIDSGDDRPTECVFTSL